MSDSDDDESFGPAPPPSISTSNLAVPATTMAPSQSPSASAVALASTDADDATTTIPDAVPPSPQSTTAKRARESEDEDMADGDKDIRYSLPLSNEYDRSFMHSGGIVGVACAAWSEGVQLVTLDASGALRWWIKLPFRGYLFAKEVNVATVGGAQCTEGSLFLLQSGNLCDPQSAGRIALVDLKEGSVRLLHADLMEIGPRLPLPWSFAATIVPTAPLLAVCTRPQLLLWQDLKGHGGATALVAAMPNEPKVVSVGLSATMSSGCTNDGVLRGTPMSTTASGTMHPVKFMEYHCLSGLVVVVDSCGIIDYVHLASSSASDVVVEWKTVRGLDEFGKQKGPAPSWARYISFPTRNKTSFFAAFRAKHEPIGLCVSDRALLLTCRGGEAVAHYCIDVASGKLIGTYTQGGCPAVQRPNHSLQQWRTCPMVPLQSTSVSRSGGAAATSSAAKEMEWWCTPSSSGDQSLVVFGILRRGSDSKAGSCQLSEDVAAESSFVLSGPSATTGEGGSCESILVPLMAQRCLVRPSQQLRNMIARSQLGSGLAADTINGLMGGGGTSSARSSESGEVSLVAVSGSHLVLFSSAERVAAAQRDFVCSDISKSLGFNFLQRDDSANEAEPLSSAATSAEGAQRVYATITIRGHEATPLRFRLLPFIAPLAVENFRALSEAGFFRGLTFHRVIKEFMLQGGCPKGDGTGGRCLLPGGGPFRDEFASAGAGDPLGEVDVGSIASMRTKYLLCMANSGPNTNASQFFITTAPTPWLAKHHTVFGVLACPPEEGDCAVMQQLLHTLECVEVDRESKPKRPMVMSDVTVTPARNQTHE